MLNKIWRASHLLLALVSATFLLLASITGIILAFEPIQQELLPHSVKGASSMPLSEFFEVIAGQYETILEVELLENDALKISTIDMNEAKDGDFIIDPFTGDKIGVLPPKSEFFQTITNVHRSLFLKSTGRLIVGITAFLFLLSIITGFLLLLQREGGLVATYRKTIKTSTDQFLHVVISKYTWLPLFIVAISGVYLSLLRFEVIPEPDMVKQIIPAQNAGSTSIPIYEFEVFSDLTLGDIKKIEFPFSEAPEDPFVIYLHHEKWKVHQYTGQLLERHKAAFISILSDWSFRLHTGSGSMVWSLVLGIATTGALILMYSGFRITYQRLKVSLPQTFKPEEAEYVLLFGSENGSTKAFTKALAEGLIKSKQKVFVGKLNQYGPFPKLKTLLILTATYGEGEAPSNGDQFLNLLAQHPPTAPFQFAVLGFGSLAYPKFCEFAKAVQKDLSALPHAQQLLDLKLIHNQSKTSFLDWGKKLRQKLGLSIPLTQHLRIAVPTLQDFKLIDRKIVKDDQQETYLITLQALGKYDFQSGDLLDFYPEADPIKRSYSISKNQEGQIQLAIKRHAWGMVSNDLLQLPLQEVMKARIEENKHFHFPENENTTAVILVGNGTGMGPFLGMIEHNRDKEIDLYWGGRSSISFELYRTPLEHAIEKKQLSNLNIAHSREGDQKQYVQDLLRKDIKCIMERLHAGAHIMICGSIAMQNEVLAVLETAVATHLNQKLDYFLLNGQIRMDCY